MWAGKMSSLSLPASPVSPEERARRSAEVARARQLRMSARGRRAEERARKLAVRDMISGVLERAVADAERTEDVNVMERVNGRAVFPSQRSVPMTSGGMSGLAGGMSAGQKAGLGAAGAVLASALTLGLMKLLSKKKSGNGDAAREERRRERRSMNSAFKKGGVVKKRNGKQMKVKMVKKAVHKTAGKH